MERFKNTLPSSRNVLVVIITAIITRISFWIYLSPVWKTYGAVVSTKYSFIEYCADFIGYHPPRSPFYEWIAGRIYLIFRPVLGSKGLSLFPLLLGIISIPFVYLFVKNVFDEKIAFFSLVFYAFFPKLVFITARALPETASLSLIVFSLYFLSKNLKGVKRLNCFLAGLFATFAYLMFWPALLFVLLAGIFILVKEKGDLLNRLSSFLIYGISGAVASFLHLMSGAFVKFMTSAGAIVGTESEFFVNPSSLSTIGKAARYIWYTHFDWWWHTRGADTAHQISSRMSILKDYLPFFRTSFSIWISATVILTTILLFSLKWVYENKQKSKWIYFALLGAGLYWIGEWYKLLFNRGLGTRHMILTLAFLSPLFGIGFSKFSKYFKKKISFYKIFKRFLPKLTYLAFLVLILTAFGQAIIQHERVKARYQDPFQVHGQELSEGKIGVPNTGSFKQLLVNQGILDVRILCKNKEKVKRRTDHRYLKFSEFPNLNIQKISEEFDYILITDRSLLNNKTANELLHSLENVSFVDIEKFRAGGSTTHLAVL